MLPERVAPAEQLPGKFILSFQKYFIVHSRYKCERGQKTQRFAGGERAFRAVLDAERRRGGGGVDGFIGRKAAELAAAAEREEQQWGHAEEEPARQRRVEVAFVACAFGQARIPPPPHLPYKVDTSRPSLRTNWTRLGAFGQSPGEAFSVRAAAELAADNTADRVRARFDVDAQWCLAARKATWFRSALCRHAPSRGGIVPRRARPEAGSYRGGPGLILFAPPRGAEPLEPFCSAARPRSTTRC